MICTAKTKYFYFSSALMEKYNCAHFFYCLHSFCSEPDLLKGYTVNIRAALWSKDSKFVFSGGEDKAMR